MRTIVVLVAIAAALGCSKESAKKDTDKAPARAADKAPAGAADNTPAGAADKATKPGEKPAASGPAFAVRVVGEGPPMLLIPGLACGDNVWLEAVERYRERYQMHLFTLAGFAGQPAIEPPFLVAVEREIVAYIRDQKLDRPVVMGHSLGAHMAMAVASAAPEAVGPVIALDGAPFGAALYNPDADAASVRPRATLLRMQASNITADQAKAQARQMFAPMVTDPDDLERVLSAVLKSTPTAIGQAMYELMTTDLRPRVSAIRTPLLLVVAGDHFEDGEEPDLGPYERQVASVAKHEVFLAQDARHFVMIDQPESVYGKIDSFLAAANRTPKQ